MLNHGNQLILLRTGQAYFPALLAAVTEARQEIYLETYLFRDDATGQQISHALIEAARRGVSVHLMIDGFGASDLPRWMTDKLDLAGVRLLVFRPEISTFALRRTRLRRLHRKLAVIDGRIGFVGGINLIDDLDAPDMAPRYDYALQVEGPLVMHIHHAMVTQWRHTAWSQLRREWAQEKTISPTLLPAGPTRARFLVRDNLRFRRRIEQAYLHAIHQAREEILIANAYFLPGKSLRRALLDAAKRGVRVRLLLQGRVDHVWIHLATRSLYHQFLSAGIEINEYTAGYMHAKVAVIDQHWLTVGSSNIDPFSLLVAREANVEAWDDQLASQLRQDLEQHIVHHARPVAPEAVRETSLRNWLVYWILPWTAFFLMRLVMAITGYGDGEYLGKPGKRRHNN